MEGGIVIRAANKELSSIGIGVGGLCRFWDVGSPGVEDRRVFSFALAGGYSQMIRFWEHLKQGRSPSHLDLASAQALQALCALGRCTSGCVLRRLFVDG